MPGTQGFNPSGSDIHGLALIDGYDRSLAVGLFSRHNNIAFIMAIFRFIVNSFGAVMNVGFIRD